MTGDHAQAWNTIQVSVCILMHPTFLGTRELYVHCVSSWVEALVLRQSGTVEGAIVQIYRMTEIPQANKPSRVDAHPASTPESEKQAGGKTNSVPSNTCI